MNELTKEINKSEARGRLVPTRRKFSDKRHKLLSFGLKSQNEGEEDPADLANEQDLP